MFSHIGGRLNNRRNFLGCRAHPIQEVLTFINPPFSNKVESKEVDEINVAELGRFGGNPGWGVDVEGLVDVVECSLSAATLTAIDTLKGNIAALNRRWDR
jgi:hypothetical protein